MSSTTTNLLQKAIAATKQTEHHQAETLLRALTAQVLKGHVRWNRNVTITLNDAIDAIDHLLSKQLSEVMHHAEFLKLEGSWRGLQQLVKNTDSNALLKIKVMHLNKQELVRDLDRAVDFDQSQLFKKIYDYEFGSPGGEPYGVMLGDYEFSNHADDIEVLHKISGIASAAFCPFIAAASAHLMGFDQWTELAKPRDLEKIFDGSEYIKWRQLRDNPDSRFIILTLPRVLARLPYGRNHHVVEAFNFEETTLNHQGQSLTMSHQHYCWMNAAYVLGERLTQAFTTHGWCSAIRGAEGGGKVLHLPLHQFVSDDGDVEIKCPTEVGITDRREAELSRLGFMPLCQYKNTDYAVFLGAETLQKPGKYDSDEANANAQISSRLPYIMATSRFAHYLKIMARDKIGAFMEIEDIEAWLNRWILNYVNGNSHSKQELKAKYPLAEAKVRIEAIPGKSGAYHAIAWLRPWLQMEELTTSLRLVARIPHYSLDRE